MLQGDCMPYDTPWYGITCLTLQQMSYDFMLLVKLNACSKKPQLLIPTPWYVINNVKSILKPILFSLSFAFEIAFTSNTQQASKVMHYKIMGTLYKDACIAHAQECMYTKQGSWQSRTRHFITSTGHITSEHLERGWLHPWGPTSLSLSRCSEHQQTVSRGTEIWTSFLWMCGTLLINQGSNFKGHT